MLLNQEPRRDVRLLIAFCGVRRTSVSPGIAALMEKI